MTDYSELALTRGMSYLAETQASIAHNLANANTAGFKRCIGVGAADGDFRTVLDQTLPLVRFTSQTDWTGGSLTETGDPFNAGLEGDGFFMVQDHAGRRFYTRNGNLTLDAQGQLCNSTGMLFLDQNGQPIALGSSDTFARSELRISPDGTVAVGNTTRSKLGLFAPPRSLQPVGDALYSDFANERPLPAFDAKVRQKTIERSNVDTLSELINMISVQRTFQASGRALASLAQIKSSFMTAFNR
jgi:flagellar basal-body rod protein FlgF